MIKASILLDLKNYIEENLYSLDIETKTTNKAIINTYREASELINFIEKEKEALLQDKLFKMIDDRNLDQVELYKKARIDRRHFSKIKSEKDYREGNL